MSQFSALVTLDFVENAKSVAFLRETLSRRLKRPVDSLPERIEDLLALAMGSHGGMEITVGIEKSAIEVERNPGRRPQAT